MSVSELSYQTLRRLPTIKQGLLKGDSYEAIGKVCGVTSRTIDRDVKAWLQSGDFYDWIKTQWIELHGKIVSKNPEEAYKQITKLFSKMVTQKREVRTELSGNLDITQKLDELIKLTDDEE